MTKVTLRELHNCTAEQKDSVVVIRNQDSVLKQMYTEHKISLNEHYKWLAKLEIDRNQIVFAVLIHEKVLGVASINAIDKLHKKSDWAFYLDENIRGGLGAALEYSLIELAFNKLGLKKLNCEVIETNKTVVKMHKKFSFTEEGFKRENIIKDNKRIGVYLLGLTASDWQENKTIIYEKYKAIIDKFEVNLEYITT
jgi:UDP-4-amino-4,6-dideoxy-N-acetyl-beta-L-altrosamine N-acetyltransferase